MGCRFLIATSAAILVCGLAVCAHAAPVSAASPTPRWLASAERQTLDRVFGGARTVHTQLISYARKVAVVWMFDRVVVFGACSAPSNAPLPRGRVIWVSYDRRTYVLLAADGMRFCEARGSWPPLAECLRR